MENMKVPMKTKPAPSMWNMLKAFSKTRNEMRRERNLRRVRTIVTLREVVTAESL